MKQAFTLAELTIVIVIIAILVAIAIPQFTKIQERAKISAAVSKLDMIRKAEAIYHSLYDVYTTSLDNLSQEVPEVAPNKINDSDWAFTINSTNLTRNFTAIATRLRGRRAGFNITINELGELGGDHPERPSIWLK